MKINNDVLTVLASCKTVGDKLYLPEGQLDRKLYVDVNKVLATLGGKWNRGQRAHVFDKDVEGIIEEAVLTGEYTDTKKEYQFFETPTELAESLVRLADIRKGETVLEPSAGRGRIAKVINKIHSNSLLECMDLNIDNRICLAGDGYNITGTDFLLATKRYDVIIANPPFTRQQDIDHINHMLDLAKRKVVSIASASVRWREDNKTGIFRERIERMGGTITPLPDDSFKSSGTRVKTCLIDVDI